MQAENTFIHAISPPPCCARTQAPGSTVGVCCCSREVDGFRINAYLPTPLGRTYPDLSRVALEALPIDLNEGVALSGYLLDRVRTAEEMFLPVVGTIIYYVRTRG